MASLTIKNIPDPLLQSLKARAVTHRRSLNSEVLACLEAAALPRPIDSDALLAEIRASRPVPRRRVTDAMINRFKKAGRM